MRRIYNTILLICVCMSVFAQTSPKEVNSKIEKVTVFLNGAQVSRSAQTSLTAGETELIFKGLAPRLNKQSIQVKGDGEFTILSVIHQINFLKEQEKRKEIEVLEKRLEEIQEEKVRAENSLDVFIQEEKMLTDNREISGSNTGVKTAELKEALDFHRARRQEVKNKQLEYQKIIQQKIEESGKVQAQLRELNNKTDLATSEILVKVTSKKAVAAKFELTYMVEEAGWYPTYDLRVKDVSSPIQLSYKANVYQNSGVEWNNVKLTLSTANPNESGVKPELKPWFIRYNEPYQVAKVNLQGRFEQKVGYFGGNKIRGRVVDNNTGESIPGVTVMVKGSTLGTVTDMDGSFELEGALNKILIFRAVGLQSQEVNVGNNTVLNVALNEDTQELSEVVVGYGGNQSARGRKAEKPEVSMDYKEYERKDIPLQTEATESAISISFEIELPYTIPSDGKTRTVEINQHELKAEYEYYCAPKIDLDAFLTANITDWEEFNLLDGEANLFFEGTFLGKTVLLPRQVEDTLSISLGRDKNIKVTRKPVKDYTKKQFIGNKKTETRTWEISIRNQKKQAINLVLEEVYPISTNKDIEVTRKDNGGAEVNNETGILTWKLNIKPSEDKKINFQYEVKYPKGSILYLD